MRRILAKAIGGYWRPTGYEMGRMPNNNDAWEFIDEALSQEMGVDELASGDDPKTRCLTCVDEEQNVEHWLTLVEFTLKYIDRGLRKIEPHERSHYGIVQEPQDAIDEFNFRCREAAVGYQCQNGKIVRIDNLLVHQEVVVPALKLLTDRRFEGAQDEFLAAHAHYRKGEFKDCAADALNALESTMKAICDARGWTYAKGARASDLVKVVRAKGLLPDYLDNSFDQLIATLSSGLPKVRNEEGGHGQGATPKATPGYVAAYALHLAAAKIVLLFEAFLALDRKR